MHLFPFSESFNSKIIINDPEYESKLKQKLINQQLKKIKTDLEKHDQLIFNSLWRKKQGFVSDGLVSRIVIYEAGIIRFKRRKYKQ
jgi:hypothetical protein